MTKAQKLRIISDTYTKLNEIEHSNELRKLHMTLADYYSALAVFNETNAPGKSTLCCMQTVADFFRKQGYTVKLETVNYRISI